MRILRINTTIGQGGAALSAMNIQKSVVELGVNSWMLSARGGQNYEQRLLSINEGKYRLAINVLAYRALGIEGYANKKLWQKILISLDEYDLIHLHNVHGYYMPIEVLRKLLSKPCVWTLHDFWLVTGGPGFPPSALRRRSIIERLLPFANFCYPAEWIDRSKQRRWQVLSLIREFNPSLAAISQAMVDRVISMGLSQSSISVVPHGLFNDDPVPTLVDRKLAKQKKGWPQDKHVFLFCAAQVDNPLKGCDVFLKALATLIKDTSWIAYVIGDKSNEARRKAIELGLNVQFIGKLSELDTRECFRACDTYVTPSLDETFGRTVVEALAEGATVICTDLPVFHEVSGANAIYFPANDVMALSNELKRLLQSSANLDNYNVAKEIRERFSKKNMAKAYLNLYETEIKRKKHNLV